MKKSGEVFIRGQHYGNMGLSVLGGTPSLVVVSRETKPKASHLGGGGRVASPKHKGLAHLHPHLSAPRPPQRQARLDLGIRPRQVLRSDIWSQGSHPKPRTSPRGAHLLFFLQRVSCPQFLASWPSPPFVL